MRDERIASIGLGVSRTRFVLDVMLENGGDRDSAQLGQKIDELGNEKLPVGFSTFDSALFWKRDNRSITDISGSLQKL
jgi:hypothetical protein